MPSDQDLTPPAPDMLDDAVVAASAALGSVPMVGSALVGFLTLLIGSPLEQRRAEWEGRIAQAIRELRARRGIEPETLKDNPAFVDAVLAATQAAIRTSQEEKRKALRNAVINSALPGAPEIAMQQMFIGTLDRFTDWHLKVLRVARDEALVAKEKGATVAPSLVSLLGRACPVLRGRQGFADVLWQELYSAGMVNTPTMHNMIGTSRTSDFGDQFLAFVADPFQETS